MDIIGIDCNMRQVFFGKEGSTDWNAAYLRKSLPRFTSHSVDIRDQEAIFKLFREAGRDISIVIHTAAQPSHDWAAEDPVTDFTVNANGTLVLLEATRKFCPNAVFIFTSSSKVYGDALNRFPWVETDTRWELEASHRFAKHGFDESLTIDQSMHSLLGASKVAGDILVQEYGRYFNIKTAVIRGGCLTGPAHSGVERHGFLSYLVKCALTDKSYTIYGYKGKQVRDNIHAYDLVSAFWQVYQAPQYGGPVYNLGGSRHSHCSILEAIALIEQITGKRLNYTIVDKPRIGDHIGWIGDVRKFQSHYPQWTYKYNLQTLLEEMVEAANPRGFRG